MGLFSKEKIECAHAGDHVAQPRGAACEECGSTFTSGFAGVTNAGATSERRLADGSPLPGVGQPRSIAIRRIGICKE
jgi:hypothetical protein